LGDTVSLLVRVSARQSTAAIYDTPVAATREPSLIAQHQRVRKRTYCIRMEDESPFFIGGMWDVWHAKEEDRLYTFTVLATFPNECQEWSMTGCR
jgi:putative SOS response-associated peptidase YedK